VSRPTPFDLIFGDFADELSAIGSASVQAGHDLGDARTFASTPEVQRLLQRIEVPALVERAPEAAGEYLALVYAAARFAAAGKPVLASPRDRLEPVLDRLPPPRLPVIPQNACYLQLPAHWIWAQATEDGPHEPLDGVFAVASPRGDVTTVVAILGWRAERGGFTQVTVQAGAADFAAARTMRRTPPFGPLMDAGASRGYRSVANPAELLALTHLALLAGGT
jgi:hypothetical protein